MSQIHTLMATLAKQEAERAAFDQAERELAYRVLDAVGKAFGVGADAAEDYILRAANVISIAKSEITEAA